MTDLTSYITLYIAIASISTGLIAIIGGLLFERIMSIRGERRAMCDRRNEISSELSESRNRREQLQGPIKELVAYKFVCDHIRQIDCIPDLVDCCLNLHAYIEEYFPLTTYDIAEYWREAVQVYDSYSHLSEKEKNDLTTNEVLKKLAENYKDKHPFQYLICEQLGYQFIEHRLHGTRLYNPICADTYFMDDYNQRTREFIDLNERIANLENEDNELENRLNALREPSGTWAGLAIFAASAMGCVFLPLLFTVFAIENLESVSYKCAEISFLVLLFLELVAILCYWGILSRRGRPVSQNSHNSQSTAT